MTAHKIHPCPSCGCDGISPCVCVLGASGKCTVCELKTLLTLALGELDANGPLHAEIRAVLLRAKGAG